MFFGKYVYNDTLVKVIETVSDKSYESVFTHQEISYNITLTIELQGEKTDQKSILF